MSYTVYGKANCTYCESAVLLLKNEKLPFRYLTVEDQSVLAELKKLVPNVKTVPQIFLGEELIGGFEEFKKHLKG
jgi:glutaredoxin 1